MSEPSYFVPSLSLSLSPRFHVTLKSSDWPNLKWTYQSHPVLVNLGNLMCLHGTWQVSRGKFFHCLVRTRPRCLGRPRCRLNPLSAAKTLGTSTQSHAFRGRLRNGSIDVHSTFLRVNNASSQSAWNWASGTNGTRDFEPLMLEKEILRCLASLFKRYWAK